MSTLTCDIVTPAKRLFSEEAYMVVVPGVEGEMGFLEDHAPLVSALADGTVRVLSDASTVAHRYALQGGYVQVSGKKVIVLADRAVPVDEIDVASVQQQQTELEQKLAEAPEEGAARKVIELDLDWCKVQEHAAQTK